jgi:site-specific recombinase XerD
MVTNNTGHFQRIKGISLKDWTMRKRPFTTTRNLQVFHRAKNAAKIIQDITFHSLRHSYPNLHERGTDIKLIQEYWSITI